MGFFDWFTRRATWAWVETLNWDAVAAIATFGAAVIAALALLSAARDSRERSRPDVLAEYRIEPRAYKALTLVVRNAGPTAARDIDVTFDPPLDDGLPTQNMRKYVRRRYLQQIPTLGPGQELTNTVSYDSENLEETDLPAELAVTISFKGYRRRRYTSTFKLHASVYRDHTYRTSSDSVEGRLKAIADQSAKAAAALQAMAKIAARSDSTNS